MRHYCTLFDKNYLERGIIVLWSLGTHSSHDFKLHVLPMDGECEALLRRLNLPHVEIVPLRYLEASHGLHKEGRTHQEYCWTCASQLMEYLMLIVGNITYLDADLMFFSDPELIFDEIGERSIGIIPHRFNKRDETRLLPNGKFNVSWVTIKNTPTGRACIERWAKQCRDWCYYRNEDGKFGDQKYLDEWAELYPGEVCEISNPGAGLAPWNLARYDFVQNDNGLRISRDRQTGLNYHCPVVFYHYHEFQQRKDGSYRLTNYPLSQSAKDLIYAPYIKALKAVEAIYIPA